MLNKIIKPLTLRGHLSPESASCCCYHTGIVRLLLVLAALIGLTLVGMALGGCTETTQPAARMASEGEAAITGDLDPGEGTFILQTLDEPPPGPVVPVPLQLIGSDLQVDVAAEKVSLAVAIRNLGDRSLFAPAEVWLARFTPQDVAVLNADMMRVPYDSNAVFVRQADDPPPDPGTIWGFDYTEQLGGDGVLDPGEISGAKTWEFHVPGLVAFSFAARVTFGLAGDLPRITGICFEDVDRNGQLDSRDQPLAGGTVLLHEPSGEVVLAHPNLHGAYAFPVRMTGLYELVYHPPLWPQYLEPRFTTPNPLRLVLPPGPDGQPQGFRGAHFGLIWQTVPPDSIPPVILVEDPPDSLVGAPYQLLGLELQGDILHLRVGFSGCQPVHPFSLYMAGGFMESLPVQANLVLVHELDEDCEAYFQASLRFNLNPIRRAYVAAYGEPGLVILHLFDYEGGVHDFTFGP